MIFNKMILCVDVFRFTCHCPSAWCNWFYLHDLSNPSKFVSDKWFPVSPLQVPNTPPRSMKLQRIFAFYWVSSSHHHLRKLCSHFETFDQFGIQHDLRRHIRKSNHLCDSRPSMPRSNWLCPSNISRLVWVRSSQLDVVCSRAMIILRCLMQYPVVYSVLYTHLHGA